MGRWDPHKIPNPPRSYHNFPGESKPTEAIQLPDSLPKECSQLPLVEEAPSLPIIVPPKASRFQRRAAIDLPLQLSLPGSSHRTRSSFSSTTSTAGTVSSSSSTASSNTEITTAVAAMRWAAARVDISPLALPSPEHELTDPMRGVTAALPHEDFSVENATTPGGNRRARLASFWEGTTDVDVIDSPKIASVPLGGGIPSKPPPRITMGSTTPTPFIPIQISETLPTPTEASSINASNSSLSPSSTLSDPATQPSILTAPPPATAPILGKGSQSPAGGSDYFGDAVSPPVKSKGKGSPPASIPSGPDYTSPGELSTGDGTLSVPALPRRVCLTRQTSSPLPMTHCLHDSRLPQAGGRATSSADSNVATMKAGRAAKEEQMFNELGYLAPPNPPDELERRRAMYKSVPDALGLRTKVWCSSICCRFNIWNTGPDLNFDRIAHLAKLVFHTKGVVICLVDGNEQLSRLDLHYAKRVVDHVPFNLIDGSSPNVMLGFIACSMHLLTALFDVVGSLFGHEGGRSYPRTQSLCGHTILQQLRVLLSPKRPRSTFRVCPRPIPRDYA